MNDSDDDTKFKYKSQRKKKSNKKKNLYSKEESDYERNKSVTDDGRGEIFFIIEIEEPKAEIDYEGELGSELKEIKELRKREGQLMHQFQDKEINKETVISIKVKLEEDKRIKEVLPRQLHEKEQIFEILEEEVILLKEELEKLKHNLKLHKGTEFISHS